jgi:hypothetical protein
MADFPRRRRPSYDEDDYDLPDPRRRSRDEEDDYIGPRHRARRPDEEYDDVDRLRRRKQQAASDRRLDNWLKVAFAGGLMVLVLLLIGGGVLVWALTRSPFRGQIDSYLTPPVGIAPAGTAVGKLVIVDVGKKDVDSLQEDLPDDLRARGPADVTTVAWLKWSQESVGSYKSGGSALQWSCQITVIDLATRRQIASQRIVGSPPPWATVGKPGASHSGDKPRNEVLAYLQGLRRK